MSPLTTLGLRLRAALVAVNLAEHGQPVPYVKESGDPGTGRFAFSSASVIWIEHRNLRAPDLARRPAGHNGGPCLWLIEAGTARRVLIQSDASTWRVDWFTDEEMAFLKSWRLKDAEVQHFCSSLFGETT